MAAIEGGADQIWFQTVVDRRTEAAAVNAMHKLGNVAHDPQSL